LGVCGPTEFAGCPIFRVLCVRWDFTNPSLLGFGFSRPYGTGASILLADPALKRWAIIGASLRALIVFSSRACGTTEVVPFPVVALAKSPEGWGRGSERTSGAEARCFTGDQLTQASKACSTRFLELRRPSASSGQALSKERYQDGGTRLLRKVREGWARSEQRQTTNLPIVSNTGVQIDVCLPLGSGTILPTRNATLSLLVGKTTVASVNIGEIDPYNNGSGFHPPITLRNCVTLEY
jgi:hypothetical protein